MKVEKTLLEGDMDNYAVGVDREPGGAAHLIFYDHEATWSGVISSTSLTPAKAESMAAALLEWAASERTRTP